MSHQIWKFAVPERDASLVDMPDGAQILSLQTQRGVPCIWALVDPTQPVHQRMFSLFGTGHAIEGASELRFVGTFQVADGELVFHLFEHPSFSQSGDSA